MDGEDRRSGKRRQVMQKKAAVPSQALDLATPRRIAGYFL